MLRADVERGPYRIAMGAIFFEGNTLSPVRSTLKDFQSKCYAEDQNVITQLENTTSEIAGALSVLRIRGDTPVPLIAAYGGAGGRVSMETWQHLRAGLLSRLKAALPVDGIYLALHGSMMCEGTDDPDGDLLSEVRALVGNTPVAVSCDMHGHITQKMFANADILIGYQLYPHDDCPETGQRTIGLLLRTLDGTITPKMGMCKVPSIVQSQRQRTKGDTPMSKLYRFARAYESSGRALAVSYFPVQPWLDVEDLGFAAVAVTDGNVAEANEIAQSLARKAWDLRDEFKVRLWNVDDAIQAGLEVPGGPVVLVEASDCTGGGASGDSTIVVGRLLELAPETSFAVLIVDKEAVQLATQAGEGAVIELELGNKLDSCYGKPLPVTAEVVRVFDGKFVYSGGVFGGSTASMGPATWLRIGAGNIVVASLSSYEYSDEQFRAAGFDAKQCKFIIAKNPMNYQQAFENAVASYILDTPGPTTAALYNISVPRAGRPFYPFDLDFKPRFEPRPKEAV